ncbi:hypothetical protein ACPRNU_05350 [Chromobacterium vaccinii]|uniref:hypothetical protein n=1 Tax=Chromobacterium vaccinii TaxID=1108595 RepID=UPI003C73731B
MTFQNTISIASHILVAIAGIIAGLFLSKYLPSYLSKKGENLATLEDIKGITQMQQEVIIEFDKARSQINHQFGIVTELLKHNNNLSTLVASERLKAHQEAFSKIHELLKTGINDNDVIKECKTWSINNCLYLNKKARVAFFTAVSNAEARIGLLKHLQETNTPSEKSLYQKQASELWDKIHSTFPKIVEGVELPAMNKGEEDILEKLIKEELIKSNDSP